MWVPTVQRLLPQIEFDIVFNITYCVLGSVCFFFGSQMSVACFKLSVLGLNYSTMTGEQKERTRGVILREGSVRRLFLSNEIIT